MNRLLCRRRPRKEKQESFEESRTRSLHLDTAFKHRAFADMEVSQEDEKSISFEKDDNGAFRVTGKKTEQGKANQGGKERIYDAKINFFEYVSNANSHINESNDGGARLKRQEQRKIFFTEASFIGSSYEGQQIQVEMQVGKAESIVSEKGQKIPKHNNNIGKNNNNVQQRRFLRSKLVDEAIAEKNQTYRWKSKQIMSSMPKVFGSFGMDTYGLSKKNEKRREPRCIEYTQRHTSFFQSIGPNVNRCISLPQVPTINDVPNYFSYIDEASSLSMSVGYDDDSVLSTAATGTEMSKQDPFDAIKEGGHGIKEQALGHEISSSNLESKEKKENEYRSPKEPLSNSDGDNCKDTSELNHYEAKLKRPGKEPFNTSHEDAHSCNLSPNREKQLEKTDQAKQNSNEFESFCHGNNLVGVRSEPGVTTESSKAIRNPGRMVKDKSIHSNVEVKQLSNESDGESGLSNHGFEFESDFSMPPADMEKVSCTCQGESSLQSRIRANQTIEADTDVTQAGMDSGYKTKHGLEEAVLIRNCENEHAVQIHFTESSSSESKKNSTARKISSSLKHKASVQHAWSLIPSTVPFEEIESASISDYEIRTRCLNEEPEVNVMPTSDATNTVDERPSTVESLRRINMNDITVSVRANSRSMNEGERARDEELGLGGGEAATRPRSKHSYSLEKLSGLLGEIYSKRKRFQLSPRKKLQDRKNRNNGKDDDIELVEIKSISDNKSADCSDGMAETKINGAEEKIKLDGTLILEGAREAEEQIKKDQERLRDQMNIEKAKIESILGNQKLSPRQTYTLIILLWAIEAEMPDKFFEIMNKSTVLHALFNEQIGSRKDLIMYNLYTENS